MKRREFMAGLGSAVAWPLAARAQQPAMPVVGFLDFGSPGPAVTYGDLFVQGLAETGFVPGRNVAIEYRWANNQGQGLARLAAELVQRQVAVIVTTRSPYAAAAAKAATSTIPIVFMLWSGDDPIKYGLVASFNRPGGNVTGVSVPGLAGKQLDLLLDLVPQVTTVGYLSGPQESRVFEKKRSDVLAAGGALGREIIVLEVRRLDFETAFANLIEQGAGALIVGTYTLFNDSRNRSKILELAARHKIPAMYPLRQFAVDGGLMSYNADSEAVVRQVGAYYVGPILKGTKPADMPIQQPTKFEFVINLKTATALDLDIPPTLLAIADEVIE
jgi:putative tryptophan/tyrosine transport system substrate-binding protein